MIDRPEHDIHGLLEILERHLRHGAHRDRARIVDQDVDGAELGTDPRDERFDLRAVGHVRGLGDDASAAPGEVGSGAREGRGIAAGDGEPRALPGQLPGESEAKATRAADDQDGLVMETVPRAAMGDRARGEQAGAYEQ